MRIRLNFLRAFGMLGATPFYQYYDEDDNLQLELYYDMERKAGVGVFYGRVMSGFTVEEYGSGVWRDCKFSVRKEKYDVSLMEEYKEYYTYNENEQIVH